MSAILLDTHAAIWYAEGRLSRSARDAAFEAKRAGSLLVSPISAWEIGLLVARRRLRLERPLKAFVDAVFRNSDITTAPLTPDIALESTLLSGPIHGDPADRILIASAIAYGATLMTRDARIRAYARTTKAFATLPC